MRNHGLQKPYNAMQVSTWVMFPLLLGHFVLFITLVLPPLISVPATFIFFISAFCTFYNGAICCKTDSMDDKLYRYLHPDIDENTIKKKYFCGCAPFHIPHPLEDEKKRQKKRLKNRPPPQREQPQPTSGTESNNNEDEPTTGNSATSGNIPRRKIFLTSPRIIMDRSRRNKAMASEGGVFFNRSMSDTVATTDSGETSTNKSHMSNGTSLLHFTRMSRQQKQVEINFQPEGSDNAANQKTSPEETKEEEKEEEKEDATKYCWVCTTQVHQHSMHCKFCDKCVSKFDHHCMWLNTCVGERNYEYFYRTVISTFFFVFIHAMCIIIFLVGYGAGGKEGVIYRNSYDWLGLRKPATLLVFNIIVLLMSIATLGLVGQLLMFHISLRKQNLTTYEFIVKSNAQKRELASMESEMHSRRMMALGRANREGRKWEKFKLICGKYKMCESIDPIRKAVLKEHEEREKSEADTANEVEATNNDIESPNETNEVNEPSSAKYPPILEQDEDIETNFQSNALPAQQQPEQSYESTTSYGNINSYTYGNNEFNANHTTEFNDNPTMSSKISLSTTASNNTEVKGQTPSAALSGLAAFRLKNAGNNMNNNNIHRMPQKHQYASPDSGSIPVSSNPDKAIGVENQNNPGSLSDSTSSRRRRSSKSKNKVNVSSDGYIDNSEMELVQRTGGPQQQQIRSEHRPLSSDKDVNIEPSQTSFIPSQTGNKVPSPTNQQHRHKSREEGQEEEDEFDENRGLSASGAASRRYGFPSHIEFDQSDDNDASSIEASLISKLTDVRSVAPSLPPQKKENDQ